MARLAAKEKLLYYPTPPRVMELIMQHIRFRTWGGQVGITILDPCAGDGTAAAIVAEYARQARPAPDQGRSNYPGSPASQRECHHRRRRTRNCFQ